MAAPWANGKLKLGRTPGKALPGMRKTPGKVPPKVPPKPPPKPAKPGPVGDGALELKIGLINDSGKYLTAEPFGFKINVSGQGMRLKQIWTIEHDKKDTHVIYIKSHLGRYLSTDKNGAITCNKENKSSQQRFVIDYDEQGRWGIKNVDFETYVGGREDKLKCDRKPVFWTPCLGVHPFVNVRSVNRKKYARYAVETVEKDNGEVEVVSRKIQYDRLIPLGADALLGLDFINGKYAIKTLDNLFLRKDGTLVDTTGPDSLYSLEIRSGLHSGVAFKDNEGFYLTAVGVRATMQTRNDTISKDELYVLEESNPQMFFTAHNSKMISSKQGVDLTANQDELSDKETFQVEYDKPTDQWRIRTCDNKYWSLEAASGIQAVGNDKCPSGLFSFEWLDGGAMAIKASNGRYITARMNGSLYAVSDGVADRERFFFTIINRPLLVLRCEFGFVGQKTNSNPRLECNKATHDIMTLEHSDEPGSYYLKGSNGKYWSLSPDCMINADSDQKHPFIFELKGQSRMFIKAPNGRYVKGEQNGIFCAKSDLSKATQWEY